MINSFKTAKMTFLCHQRSLETTWFDVSLSHRS